MEIKDKTVKKTTGYLQKVKSYHNLPLKLLNTNLCDIKFPIALLLLIKCQCELLKSRYRFRTKCEEAYLRAVSRQNVPRTIWSKFPGTAPKFSLSRLPSRLYSDRQASVAMARNIANTVGIREAPRLLIRCCF